MAVESIAELKTAVSKLIQIITGVNAVIEANQDQAPPPGLYGTYNITPMRAYGHPRKVRVDTPAEEPGPEPDWTDYSESTISQILINVSINFFEPGSLEAITKLHNANFRQPVREHLYQNDMAWRNAGDIRELSDKYNGQIQQRFQADVQLVVETSITDTVLKAAGFSIEVIDENGNIISSGGV